MSDYEDEIRQRALARQEAQNEIDLQARTKVAIDSVMTSHHGRVLLKLIFAACDPNEPVFCSDPLQMAFNEGRRSIGVRLKETLGTEYFRAIEDEEI